MKEFTYVINDELGIHARPAGHIVMAAKAYKSDVTISKAGKTVNATRLMSLMGLCVKKGDEITVAADGADEDAAIEALKALFEEKL